VWDLISRVLKDPERLSAGLEEMIELERAELRGDPDQEAKTWLAKLSEVGQERRGYLRLAAKGVLTDEELDEALAGLEDMRETAEKELRAIRARRETLQDLERDRDALLESYASMTPAALDALSPEERHQAQHAPASGSRFSVSRPGLAHAKAQTLTSPPAKPGVLTGWPL
jgi:multidrug resistance efflux pump